ncbi:MAG: sodium:solute symporter family protein [Candidatus Glassbacteria bacterium]
MKLQTLDVTLVALYFMLTLAIGLYHRRRASLSMESFFITGRRLKWWLAGTSMVATTFAADTPLAVTGLVTKNGIAGNWLWWNMALSGMLTVFLFSRLWRRAGIVTDVEFTEIRYGGKPAALLRAFRGFYLSVPVNLIIMGWVILAMAKILGYLFGVDKLVTVMLCVVFTGIYSTLSGIWGVVITDFLQFIIAMGGTVALAYFSVDSVGGIHGLRDLLTTRYGDVTGLFSFIPEPDSVWMPLGTFLIYIGMSWWASWYPGAEPGGGGYIVQRMLSTTDERESMLSTLWFNIAHYAIRPWPWILTALVALALYGKGKDPELGYVRLMAEVMPVGFRGLLLVGFLAAFMSTLSTHLNWGSSYLVNDLYRRFLVKNENERHYVLISRVFTVTLVVLAAIVSMHMDSVEKAWKFLIAIGAGTGPVYILRWYWWRINSWSEISAMLAAFVVSISLQEFWNFSTDAPTEFVLLLVFTTALTTIAWLSVTFLTPPESDETLSQFWMKIKPSGTPWGGIKEEKHMMDCNGILKPICMWMVGSFLVYSTLFAFGKFLLGFPHQGTAMALIAVASGVLLKVLMR